MGFVFYDTEATGTSPAYDQSPQFAAIRISVSFSQIERISLRCGSRPIVSTGFALTEAWITATSLGKMDAENQ